MGYVVPPPKILRGIVPPVPPLDYARAPTSDTSPCLCRTRRHNLTLWPCVVWMWEPGASTLKSLMRLSELLQFVLFTKTYINTRGVARGGPRGPSPPLESKEKKLSVSCRSTKYGCAHSKTFKYFCVCTKRSGSRGGRGGVYGEPATDAAPGPPTCNFWLRP